MDKTSSSFDIVEFDLGNRYFGINVEKVKEVFIYSGVTPIPCSHQFVEGLFKSRDSILTIINLAGILGVGNGSRSGRQLIMHTRFNRLNCGFHINKVEGVHQVYWSDIEPTDYEYATGVIHAFGHEIILPDFERIISIISPESGLKMSEISILGERPTNDIPIITADDSPLLRQMVNDSLTRAGFTNIKSFENGMKAWEYISDVKKQYGSDASRHIGCVITDIEMPVMDGYRLTSLIKSDFSLQNIPVIIFSSLINDDMRRDGRGAGADVLLTKPEIGLLVIELDRLLEEAGGLN